ncbi:4'-phosphopantetheinyl transferase superfamily protein [Psychrobacter sp. M13]|uniref:4'-phosphopantetheinyl transferase family protein n=1 Tax=Psychrobacter sp. M13 TaxID=3067275 RepID=UPI00273A8DEC|nr:4'-phosphopantetheinyl transferase superfamily protein [Psychrobacter sp. M13]WLP95549.1 4'-phosphopantetheinyl transferase superfamily protein [Psychrobacter sp. M13]
MISLNNIQFTQLDANSYCATASLALTVPIVGSDAWTDKTSKRQNQRNGVRLLLQRLLTELAIVDTLDELAFPYRLSRHGYYVCFSHSADKVAVAISYQQAVGIDVEVNTVAWKVAKRYYHASEIAILELLPNAKRDYLVKLLWQVKESLIKIDQNKLAAGLGVPYTALARQLVENDDIADSSSIQLNHHHAANRQLMILATQQTIVVF